MRNQPRTLTRLLLAASISIASFSLVACGGNDSPNNSQQTPDGNSSTTGASYYLATYNGEVTPTTAVTWEGSDSEHKDDRIEKLTVNNGNLIAQSRWYNDIVRVPTSSSDATVVPVGFSSLRTSHEGRDSSDEDYISGASEHRLLDSWYADDDSAMYALVQKPLATVADDDTYGLFKVPLNADGSVPSTEEKGHKIYHRGAGVKSVGNTMSSSFSFTAALPLTDDRILALDKNNDAVAVLSSDLALDESSSFSVANINVDGWVANSGGAYLLVEDSNKQMKLQKHALNNLKEVANSVDVEDGYLASNKNSDYVVLASGNQVKLFDSNLSLAKTFTLANKADALSLSEDGERLAVKTSKDGEVVLIDIKADKPAVTTLTLEDEFDYFTMGDKNTIFVSFNRKDSEVKKISLTAEPTALNTEQLLAVAMESISAESANHDLAPTNVRSNLALITNKSGALPNVDYKWTSSNDAVINAKTGAVTQPAIGGSAVPVTLTLTATATLDGVTKSESKVLEFTVLPKIATKSFSNSLTVSSALTDRYSFRDIVPNSSNSKIALFADDHHGSADKWGIVLVDNNNGTLSTDDKFIALPAPYNDQWIRGMIWKDDTTLRVFAAGVSGADGEAPMPGAIFELNTNTKELTKVGEMDEYIRSPIVLSEDKSIVNVLTMGADEKFTMSTYNMSDLSKVSSYDFPKREWNFAIDSTGDFVYGYSGNKFVRYNKGVVDAEIPAEGIGRFYSLDLTGGTLVGGDRDGNFAVLENATGTSAPTVDDVNVTITGYGGRMYAIAAMGDKVIASYRGVGVSVYAKDSTGYKEQLFINEPNMYRFGMNNDGSQLITVPLKGTGGTVNLINLH